MCDDEIGRLLYKAVKAAPGSEVKPGSDTPEVEMGPRHIGPAHARMHSLAIDRQKERSIPYAHAYSEVYTHAANAALRAAVQREHLEDQLEGIHGSGGVSGTLSIQEAQRAGENEPTGGGKVRDFPGSAYGASQARKNAEAELQKLAEAHHAKFGTKSVAISYSKILTDPQHVAIRKAALVA